jgi:DNA-binding SARP family transcriptional activator
MWRGEPLPEDRYASWAAPTRERLIDLYVGVLADLSELESRRGDWVGMVDLARRRLAFDPLDEAAHRDLILAYARSGRRGHALRQFLECRRALVDQLGVEPSAATAELHARVLAGASV